VSINVKAKLHPFKDDRSDFQCEAAPLSELYARLNPPLDIAHARFLIDDEMVADSGRTPPDGSTVIINVVAAGGGDPKSAGKATFWIGLQLSVLGIVALFIPVVGAALGSAIIGAGVSMMLGGAVLMNTEIPSASVRETGSQMESVRGSKNQARKLGYIPVLFGRHLVTPDVAALPYTEIDSNGEQWLVQLFCAGYNDLAIETGSFKVGDTALAELSETKDIDTILAGNDGKVKLQILRDGASSTLYPSICVEQQFNAILKHADDNGLLSPRVHTTPDKTTRVNVDIMFPQGLVKYDDEGKKKTASVLVSIQYKPDSAPDSSYADFPGWASAVSGQTVDMFRLQATVSGLSPGKYTVRIARVTADSADSKTIDTVYVGSIRSFANDRPVREAAAKDLALIALKVKASALASGIIDNFNFVAQSVVPDYTPATGAWTPRLTKNPASMLLYALQGKVNPDPVADSDIDWDSLRDFWAFCNDKNYTCNAVQGDRELFSVLCAKIAKTGRASILRMNGKFSVVIDRERPAPVQLFSPRNTINYRQTIVKADVPDEIALEFIDETRDWASNERSVYNTPDGLPAGDEKTKQASSVWGITDPDTAFKFARYQFACATNRPVVHALECDIEYLLCKKGDLIEYAGDTALAGVAHGKVTAVILYEGAAVGIVADTLFPQEAGKSYGIRCRKSNGQLVTLNVVNRETSEKDLRFATPQAADILEEGDLVIFGIAGQITRRLIVAEIAPADNFRATLSCVDYAPEIFGVDDPDYVAPPFDNKITTDGSITDSGIVNTSEWQTWFTYHDSVEMPAKPAGGGAAGGWHRYQTPESRWVSTKTAKSITDGDWSIPSQTGFLIDETLRGLIAAGIPGPPATEHRLIPSARTIKRYNTGVVDPPTISCIQQSITGNDPPVTSDKMLTYITSGGEETLYEGPVTVGDWDQIEFRLYDDNGAPLDRETVPVLTDGPPATVYSLSTSSPMIIRNPSGVAVPSAISCSQQVVVGSKPPELSDKTIVYITSVNQTETLYTGPVPVAWDWIEFRLRDGEALLAQRQVFVLSEGEPARTYKLQPSAPSIKVHDGRADPYKISCSQVSITGNGLPVPSDKTLKYTTSAVELAGADKFEILHYPGGCPGDIFTPMLGDFYPVRLKVAVDEQPYTGEITVNPKWGWIEFLLYDGDILLEKERVPVLSNGTAPMYLDLVDQHITVRADEYGNPCGLPITTQAILYNGNTPVTYEAFKAKVAEKNIIHYPGNIFDPMLGGFYPVRMTQWSISRGTIDQNGIITINELPEDRAEIEVRALYDGVEHTAVLTIIKAKDAERPVVVDIENENTSIACDVHGDPYPGALPLRTKALLYWGTELVSPFWFLEAKRGVAIAQDGTITVAQDAELADVNNALIKAAYKGKTYARMFTLTKTRDGESPVALNILPDNEVVPCDYLGNPLRGLPLTAKATLFKGTQEITAAMEIAEADRVEILHYPGNHQGNIFDPMLGGFYPTLGYPVAWSLADAPAGVTIDRYGLITVSETAQLNDSNHITVRATYHGKTYEAVFGIAKARGGVPAAAAINGKYVDFRFAKNVSLTTPPAHTAAADNPGAAWTDTPPSLASGEYLWQITSEWRDSTRLTDWTPVRISGQAGEAGNYYEPRYCRSATQPETPTGDNPSAWSVSPPEGTDYLWMTLGLKNAAGALQGAWSAPARISGENGKDGDAANVPKYRGVTAAADMGNTGEVRLTSGVDITMNDLDWVLFMGTADWTRARLYRWNAKTSIWTRMEPAQNTLEYMEALRDITEDAPDGIFSDIFCQVLFAQQAAIETLESQLIQITGAIFGGERFTKNGDTVVDNGEDKPGFKLGEDGVLRASKGMFNDIHILGDSIFSGDIVSGPLILNNDSPEGDKLEYQSGRAASEIVVANNAAQVVGSYGANPIIKIWKEESRTGEYPPKSTNKPAYLYTDLYVFYAEGTQERIARHQTKTWLDNQYMFHWEESDPKKTSSYLEFQYVIAGKTLRLIDLPTSPTEPGAVYIGAGGHLMIKLAE
jgi:hypothetical protein